MALLSLFLNLWFTLTGISIRRSPTFHKICCGFLRHVEHQVPAEQLCHKEDYLQGATIELLLGKADLLKNKAWLEEASAH
jgi:hypothetical protein